MKTETTDGGSTRKSLRTCLLVAGLLTAPVFAATVNFDGARTGEAPAG